MNASMMRRNESGRMSGRGRMPGLVAGVVASVMGLAGATPVRAQVLADSVADFSGVQGQSGWWYGYYDGRGDSPWGPGDFKLLPAFAPGEDGASGVWYRRLGAGGYWTAVNTTAAHPNGTLTTGGRAPEENWAVRRWVSEVTMPLRINGFIRDAGLGEGNGIVAHIFVAGVEVWTRTLEDGDMAGRNFSISACIEAGEAVDFVLDPRGASDRSDGTLFEATIRGPIDEQPRSVYACPSEPAIFRMTVADARSCVLQWCKDGVPIAGATGATLVIDSPHEEDEGEYTCRATDACGSVVSEAASLIVCPADLNCDGLVDFGDYLAFLTLFDFVDPRADLNQDGAVDFGDFLEFINLFDEGC